MSPTNNENQNDFYINVSNVASGLYKVIITATNGYTYESEELNHDITVPSTNIEPNEKRLTLLGFVILLQ